MNGSNEIKELVKKIFEIIPSYYDEREAEEVERLIKEFISNHQ